MNSRRQTAPLAALTAALALSTTACKVDVEATVEGPVFGAPDKMRVTVIGAGGSDITCSDNACEPKKADSSGRAWIEVKVPAGESKVVTVTSKKGLRRGSKTIDLGAGGRGSRIELTKGGIMCLPAGCKGRLDVAPAPKITLEAAAGTTVDVGGEKLTVPASGTLSSPLKLAGAPSLEKHSLDKICTGGTASPTAVTSTTLTVTLPGKPAMTTKVDIDTALLEQSLSFALADVKKGPVVFPWEKPGEPAKGKRAAVYTDGSACYDSGAAGATVADLDVIAVATVETREDECVYRLTTGGTASGALTLYDKRATAYDRTTGRVLGTKLFTAPKNCNEAITVRGGSTTTTRQTSSVANDVVAQWAATFAK